MHAFVLSLDIFEDDYQGAPLNDICWHYIHYSSTPKEVLL